MTYVEDDDTVEDSADGLGDIATRGLGLRSSTERATLVNEPK